MVGEASGADEELASHCFVGKSGSYLWSALKRVGLTRDDFYIVNTLACRPPDNKLVGEPYARQAIAQCSSHLDGVLAHCGSVAAARNSPLVILTLSKVAFKHILDLDDAKHARLLKEDYLCYPFWSEKYSAWVLAADHPAYLARGNHHLVSVLQFAAARAIEIADNGFSYTTPEYILDPAPQDFEAWIDAYLNALAKDPEGIYLSYDIETPMKQGNDEEAVSREDDDDYTIIRCAFSYEPNKAVTVPWRTEYFSALSRLLKVNGQRIGWNNVKYDDPRINAQIRMGGGSIDAMYAWHVLNSALPKGLGFVGPFYAHDISIWKHLSDSEPAWYNCKDADVALRCWLGIKEDLVKAKLWDVFRSHEIEMAKVFSYMSGKGVLRDNALRDQAEHQLKEVIDGIQNNIEQVVPFEAKRLKAFKREPVDLSGLVQVPGLQTTKRCAVCGELDVLAAHFKSVGKKRLKSGEPENPCVDGYSLKIEVPSQLWAEVQPFKISKDSLTRYQGVVGHFPILDPKEKKVTFDDKALLRLRKKYPKDQLYPLIGDFRENQKLITTYIGLTQLDGSVKGGLPVDEYGLIHTSFTTNPSTLRTASQNPNLQNLPRPGGPDDPATIIRSLVVARPGHLFLARDYSGIEAVLVGYFARLPGYIRLAKRDVHSFYTAYALYELERRIPANDLPQLSWDDERLFKRLDEIKAEFKHERNSLYKHLVHGANFMQGAKGAAEKILAETGREFPTALVKRVMDIYFELFPGIRKWHKEELLQADETGFVRNPFGYVHRFYRVYQWEKIGNQWQREIGPDGNKVIANKPQSTAAGIIKEAMLRMYFDRFEECGQYLRLIIHDEIMSEVPETELEAVDRVMQEEMEKPIWCMPMPEEWKMGTHLTILTESKHGSPWGAMK